jgi:hypothetical protein
MHLDKRAFAVAGRVAFALAMACSIEVGQP